MLDKHVLSYYENEKAFVSRHAPRGVILILKPQTRGHTQTHMETHAKGRGEIRTNVQGANVVFLPFEKKEKEQKGGGT